MSKSSTICATSLVALATLLLGSCGIGGVLGPSDGLTIATVNTAGSFEELGVTVNLRRGGAPVVGETITIALGANPGAALLHGSRQYVERVDPNLPSILDPLPGVFNGLGEITHVGYDPGRDRIFLGNTSSDFFQR